MCAPRSMLGFVPKDFYPCTSMWRNPELQQVQMPFLLSPKLLWAVHCLLCLCSHRIVCRKVIAANAAEQQFPTGEILFQEAFTFLSPSVFQCNTPVPVLVCPSWFMVIPPFFYPQHSQPSIPLLLAGEKAGHCSWICALHPASSRSNRALRCANCKSQHFLQGRHQLKFSPAISVPKASCIDRQARGDRKRKSK